MDGSKTSNEKIKIMKPKVAFLIRGHIRNSLEDRKLNDFLLSCQDIIDFDLYMQTWNKKEASKSWRDSKIEKLSVNDGQVLSYFDDSLKLKIKNLLVLDDSKLELHGNLEGKIGKSQCPTIGWKYMWSGMYENICQIPEDHNYKFAVNTRFDILTEGLDSFCRRPSHTKNFTPRTHLDFIKQMIVLRRFNELKYIYSLYDIVGCDNFIGSSVDNIRWLIESFHFELDEILPKWIDSNFRTKNQEACVRWFLKTHSLFRFNGAPII